MNQRYASGNGGGAVSAVRRPYATDVGIKEIPYDYVATFELTGQVGNRLQEVINVSVEGTFVAVAVGYSFLPPRPAVNQPVPGPGAVARGRANLAARLAAASSAVKSATSGSNTGPSSFAALLGGLIPGVITAQRAAFAFECLERRLCGLDFLYSVVDSGSGRELQNQAIHNIAGLGSADGERPFRPLAKPMAFEPRSTIRIEVTEQSAGEIYEGSTLYIVLHGYKILGHGMPR